MAHSLELRSPLLDHRVVELGLALPDRLKQRGREGKIALRRAFAAELPDRRRGARQERASAFRSPRGSAASCSRSRTTCCSTSRARARGWFRADAVERLLDEHAAERADHGHRLWTLVMLELWQRAHVDAPVTTAVA